MVATQQPFLTEANSSDQVRSMSQSFIIYETGYNQYHWQGEGWLSIKSFRGGTAFYNAGQGYFAVDDDHYLVLNQGQRYSINIESDQPVNSFCVFFAAGLTQDVYRSLTSSQSLLLDQPDGGSRAINFFEKTYPHDDVLSPALSRLMQSLARTTPVREWMDEQLHDLMERLLEVHPGSAGKRTACLPHALGRGRNSTAGCPERETTCLHGWTSLSCLTIWLAWPAFRRTISSERSVMLLANHHTSTWYRDGSKGRPSCWPEPAGR